MGYVSFSKLCNLSTYKRLFKLNNTLDKRASVMEKCYAPHTAEQSPVVSFFAHYLQAVISVAANIFLGMVVA